MLPTNLFELQGFIATKTGILILYINTDITLIKYTVYNLVMSGDNISLIN